MSEDIESQIKELDALCANLTRDPNEQRWANICTKLKNELDKAMIENQILRRNCERLDEELRARVYYQEQLEKAEREIKDLKDMGSLETHAGLVSQNKSLRMSLEDSKDETNRWADSACRLEEKLKRSEESRGRLLEALKKISSANPQHWPGCAYALIIEAKEALEREGKE